jgi:hypothetical protein
MKRLIFLCGYDEFYFGLATMTARTIRESGYDDDLIIFTIQDKTSPYGICLNLASHPESHLVQPKGWKYFHRSLCTAFGHDSYSSPHDYFMIKTLPGSIVDRNQYDFILYMDSDILVHAGQSLDEIFRYREPVSDFNSRAALRDVKGLRKHLSPEEAEAARKMRGIGGGSFGIPRTHFAFFDVYRENYLRYLSEIPHDQPVLSFVKIRHRKEYPFAQWENRKFFRHYWGKQKREMMGDFIKRYGWEAFREILLTMEMPEADSRATQGS